MSIIAQKSSSITRFAKSVYEATAKLLQKEMKYNLLSKQEARFAFLGLVPLLVFPVFAGYSYVNSLLAVGNGSTPLFFLLIALFFGAMTIIVTFGIEVMLIAFVSWCVSFVKHFIS
jgi:hypothetical protein